MDFHQLVGAGGLSIEQLLELHRRAVFEVAVQAGSVMPVDPPESGQLHVFNGLPRPFLGAGGATDQLGFVVAVDSLSQGIVIAVGHGPD